MYVRDITGNPAEVADEPASRKKVDSPKRGKRLQPRSSFKYVDLSDRRHSRSISLTY